MFDEPLPKEADLRKLAVREAHFKASLSAKILPRFSEVVFEGAGRIDVDLHLGVDAQRVRFLRGTIDCDTQLLCQRCMQPMPVQIHADVNLGVMWDELEAQHLSKSMDPLVSGEDETVNLNTVVEDELLINMPFVSYHDTATCNDQQNYSFADPAAKMAEEVAKPEKTEKKNPFSVLESLKN
jgi:uncharacterized protein